MGRKAIYATQAKYQPYIDIIRQDLQLPYDMLIEFKFAPYKLIGGSATYYHDRYAYIRVDNNSGHKYTLNTLMHELRHIWQHYTGKMQTTWIRANRKNGVMHEHRIWEGKTYPFYDISLAKRAGNYALYKNQPWEVDARDYADKVTRLFPNNQLPIYSRILVATTSDGVRWYKG